MSLEPPDFGEPRAPVPRQTSLDDDLDKMKGGKLLPLVFAAIAALAVTAVGAVLLMQGDDTEPYRAYDREVNQLRAENFDRFWSCALPRQDLSELRNNRDLTAAIHERARRRPQEFARYVREDCLVQISELAPSLRALTPPSDLGELAMDIAAKATEIRLGWEEYLQQIQNVETYDPSAVRESVGRIVRGWFDYRNAHRAINDAVRERVGD